MKSYHCQVDHQIHPLVKEEKTIHTYKRQLKQYNLFESKQECLDHSGALPQCHLATRREADAEQ